VDVTVAVATFGEERWPQLARERAIPSAEALGVPVVHAHRATLHAARNAVLDDVQTEWVVHLDADDELEAGYVDAMAAGTADVRAPAVRYVYSNGRADWPRMPHVAGHNHDCVAECLPHGNWLVIGAAVRVELARRVGGWRDFPWSEDWDMWVRCYRAGATFEAVPKAIYRAHVRPDSRNRSALRSARLAAHRAIVTANGGTDFVTAPRACALCGYPTLNDFYVAIPGEPAVAHTISCGPILNGMTPVITPTHERLPDGSYRRLP